MKNIAFYLLVIGSHFVIGQSKHSITHEDMWLLKRVAAPAISPDGKWVVFSVLEPSYDSKEQINDLWIVPSDASAPPRKITAGKASESSYSWSPDSRSIAFVAKRDGDEESQIYTLNLAQGGEAQKLTKLSSGASGPKWSPDGMKILFTSDIFPLCYADSTNKKMIEEKKKLKYKARVYTGFPIRNWDHWLDEKQTHVYVQSVHPDSVAQNIFSNVAISKEAGFSFLSACWAPDSKEVLFAASTNSNTAAYQEPNFQLYRVSISGGDAIALTSMEENFENPAFSLDGKYLICLSSITNNNKVYNENKLVRFDWPTMKNKAILNSKLDRPIQNYCIAADKLYLAVEDRGHNTIYSIHIANASLNKLSKEAIGSYSNLSCSKTNPAIVVGNYESATMPPEIVRFTEERTHYSLSYFNKVKLSELELNPIEEVWFKSSRGKQIRSVLVKPAGFDPSKKYPLFVLIHGGPAGAWLDNWSYRWNYQLLAKPGYILLATDFTGSTGYGEKFSQEIALDPFKGPGDEINEAAADAINRFSFIDGTKQAAGGASYGGHLANWLQATTSHYKCLISHAGLVNSISQWGTSDAIFNRETMNGGTPWSTSKTWKEQNPFMYADQFKTPMLVTVGELDYRVPVNNSIENWNILQRQKVPSKLIVFPEENHWILKAENSKFFYQEVQAWLEKYLK